jgi:NADPH:quinone reductase
MRAVWYETQGPAREVLKLGTMPDPRPGSGEVRIRIVASGINPGDIKKRQDAFGCGMPYPRVIPHSDGAGDVDLVGEDVSADWVGRRVWCYGAQSYRPFGTAAEYTVVPTAQVVRLPEGVSFEQGACGYSRDHCTSVCSPRRSDRGSHRSCAGRRGRRRSVRSAAGPSCRRDSDRDSTLVRR